jgi:hypothetical protein
MQLRALDGDDPVAFIQAQNNHRRHLNKGQQATAMAKARLLSTRYTRGAATQTGVSQTLIVRASLVLEFATELAGIESLNDALYEGAVTQRGTRAAEGFGVSRTK